MKTRQEMIYDFMISLSSNSSIYDDWNSMGIDIAIGSYSEHLLSLSEEMADLILGNT